MLMGPYVIGFFCAGLLCDGSFCDRSFSDGTLCRGDQIIQYMLSYGKPSTQSHKFVTNAQPLHCHNHIR